MIDASLPGLTPAYCRIEVVAVDEGYWEVRVGASDGPGLWCAASWTSYGPLAAGEAWDVVGATLEGWGFA